MPRGTRSWFDPSLSRRGNDGSPLVEDGHEVPLKNDKGYYVRKCPENVTIKNCVIKGVVRVWGLGTNGQDGYQWHSSRDLAAPGHVQRVRDAAPTRITFENVTIESTGWILFYLGPGTTYVTLKNSELTGKGALNVYFDAETAFNVVTGNHIHAKTNREVFALDGSSHNEITDNRFSSLNNGGIYLYRNCGEGGAVRVSTPSHNRIANNHFYYNRYDGPNPAVWIGSRNTVTHDHYCGKDKGVDYGSGASDWDYAQCNQVRNNQIVKRLGLRHDRRWARQTPDCSRGDAQESPRGQLWQHHRRQQDSPLIAGYDASTDCHRNSQLTFRTTNPMGHCRSNLGYMWRICAFEPLAVTLTHVPTMRKPFDVLIPSHGFCKC